MGQKLQLKIFLLHENFTCKNVCLNACKHLFRSGCTGSLLPCVGFLQLQQAGLLSSRGAQASHGSGFSCRARALGCEGFSSCCPRTQSLHFLGSGTQARWLWCTGLLGAPRNVGSFQTRDQTSNPCLLHWQVDSTAEPQGRP